MNLEEFLEKQYELQKLTYQIMKRMEKQSAATHSIQVSAYVRSILEDEKYADSRRLQVFGFKGQSQFDEDGILQEIFQRIGTTSRKLMEIGAGEGLENNSVYLLQQGWTCYWVEAQESRCQFIRDKFSAAIRNGTLMLISGLVEPSNVNGLIATDDDEEFDLWTLDVDGNDYWIFKAFDPSVLKPRVIMLEYNAKFRPPMEWAKAFDMNHQFDKSDYMGASLESLTRLAAEKGYCLVGCGLSGANAYFVRSDLATPELFCDPFTAENHYEPGRYWLTRGFYSGMPQNSFGPALNESNKDIFG